MKARHLSLLSAVLAGLSLTGASAAFAQGVQLFAVLNGGNEVGPTGLAAAGDPDGQGAASVIYIGSTAICFSILVDNIDAPVAAHIHQNVAGRNGPIVVNLTPPNAGNPGVVSRCLFNLDAATLRAIRATPSEYYVNVHTGAFPAGAVRGQLF